MFTMYLLEIFRLNFRSNQSKLGKPESPCNADKIRVVLPVKQLISNDKFDMNYSSTAIILAISLIQLFEVI